jgi:hypothetical protein
VRAHHSHVISVFFAVLIHASSFVFVVVRRSSFPVFLVVVRVRGS